VGGGRRAPWRGAVLPGAWRRRVSPHALHPRLVLGASISRRAIHDVAATSSAPSVSSSDARAGCGARARRRTSASRWSKERDRERGEIWWRGFRHVDPLCHIGENHPRKPPRGVNWTIFIVCGYSIPGFMVGGWNPNNVYRWGLWDGRPNEAM
jgi:hypothetical protein